MTQLTKVQQQEQELLQKAASWVDRQVTDQVCPFCGAVSTGVKAVDAKDAFMTNHLIAKHPTATVKAYEQQTLEPILRDEDPDTTVHEALGLESVNTTDRFDSLYVPLEIRQEAARNGETLRWAAPDRVRHYLDQGALSAVKPKDGMPNQRSSEDTTARTNEMVLIRIPEGLRLKRARVREGRINNQLAARAEELGKARSSMAETAYNYMVRRGADTQQAMNVANAIEAGAKVGNIPGVRLNIQDQKGTSTL